MARIISNRDQQKKIIKSQMLTSRINAIPFFMN
jgi:hypothetical protein